MLLKFTTAFLMEIKKATTVHSPLFYLSIGGKQRSFLNTTIFTKYHIVVLLLLSNCLPGSLIFCLPSLLLLIVITLYLKVVIDMFH